MNVLLINFAATVMLTGIGWSIQLVQLPLFKPDQLAAHRRLNSRLVLLPMAAEFITAVWLAIDQRRPPQIAALILWAGVGYATYRYSMLHLGSPEIAKLKRWNLIRVLCWTARSAILWIVIRDPGI